MGIQVGGADKLNMLNKMMDECMTDDALLAPKCWYQLSVSAGNNWTTRRHAFSVILKCDHIMWCGV